MFRILFMTVSAVLLVMSNVARADHKGLGSGHVVPGLELGERLSTKHDPRDAQTDHARIGSAEQPISRETSLAKSPARKVRIVYPAP